MLKGLKSNLDGITWDLNEPSCSHMVSFMMVVEHVGVKMVKEHFEIKASKSIPQYGFRKGLQLFGDEGYQATKDEFKANLLG